MPKRPDPFQEYRNLSGLAPKYLSEEASAVEQAAAAREHTIMPEETAISKDINGARTEWDLAQEHRRNAHEDALKELIMGMKEEKEEMEADLEEPKMGKKKMPFPPFAKKGLAASKGMKAINMMKKKGLGY